MVKKIILLGKPESTNHIYKRHGNIIYMSKEGKDLKASYTYQARNQWKDKITETPVSVKIDLYFSNHLRRDIDNWHKLTLDSLTGIVWKDDSQINRLLVTKNIDKGNPRIEINIDVC